MEMDDSQSQEEAGWISWFCGIDDNFFLCQVEEDYIRDSFNLYGLKQRFELYNDALDMILLSETPDEEELEDEGFLKVFQQASDLYGLIHARYITTQKGLLEMREKYYQGDFGVCPRVLCERQYVLPVGMSEDLRTSRVKVFCPRCQDIYIPKKKCSEVDGAYFGCSFASLFLTTFQDLQIKPASSVYVPRIFGFKVYQQKGSKYHHKNDSLEKITYYDERKLKQKINQNPKQENYYNNQWKT